MQTMDTSNQLTDESQQATCVLPIVGRDVGAIGFISLSASVRSDETLLNIRINFEH